MYMTCTYMYTYCHVISADGMHVYMYMYVYQLLAYDVHDSVQDNLEGSSLTSPKPKGQCLVADLEWYLGFHGTSLWAGSSTKKY